MTQKFIYYVDPHPIDMLFLFSVIRPRIKLDKKVKAVHRPILVMPISESGLSCMSMCDELKA